MATHHKLHLE